MDLFKLIASWFESWQFDPITALITLALLPAVIFVLKIFAEGVKRLGIYAFEGLLYGLSRAIKHSIAATFTLRRYCRVQLDGQSKYLTVPSTLEKRLEIDDVYISLFMEQEGRSQITYSDRDMLSVGNRIIVAGDPGSGKSSLLKKLFRDMCHVGIARPIRAQLPIWIELRKLVIPSKIEDSDLGDWLYTYVKKTIVQSPVYNMEECFENYVQTTGLLILLDGLDEVSSKESDRVWKAIRALSDRLVIQAINNTIVLTMRGQFYQHIKGTSEDTFPYVMFLKPFSPSDIYEFLVRWPFEDIKKDAPLLIFNSLADRPTLREMCSNPLILAMYTAETELTGVAVTPDTRTQFYKKVTEELIIKRRLRQSSNTKARLQLQEQRERILGTLAYEHLMDPTQPANSLSWIQALNVVISVTGCTLDEAESIFQDLAIDTGLVNEERAGETFRFIHLTFGEYLAAHEAINGRVNGWAQLLNRHSEFRYHNEAQVRTRLLEVIPFAAGLSLRVQRQDVLTDILTFDDWQMTARVLLEIKTYDHPSFSGFVTETRDELLAQPESNWTPEWLRSLHLFNILIMDAQHSAAHIKGSILTVNLEQFYRKLLSIQQNSLSKLISIYASQDAAAVFRLADVSQLNIARQFPEIVVRNCDQKPFFGLVLQKARGQAENSRLWITLLAEAALRSRVVATWLSDMPPDKELGSEVRKVPRGFRWLGSGIVGDSVLSQVITLACYYGESYGKNLLMLDLIKLTPAPTLLMVSSTPLTVAGSAIVLFISASLISYVTTPVSSDLIFTWPQLYTPAFLVCLTVILSMRILSIIRNRSSILRPETAKSPTFTTTRITALLATLWISALVLMYIPPRSEVVVVYGHIFFFLPFLLLATFFHSLAVDRYNRIRTLLRLILAGDSSREASKTIIERHYLFDERAYTLKEWHETSSTQDLLMQLYLRARRLGWPGQLPRPNNLDGTEPMRYSRSDMLDILELSTLYKTQAQNFRD